MYLNDYSSEDNVPNNSSNNENVSQFNFPASAIPASTAPLAAVPNDGSAIMVPPMAPRTYEHSQSAYSKSLSGNKRDISSSKYISKPAKTSKLPKDQPVHVDSDEDEDDEDGGPPKILTQHQKVERRERNREHAKRSRIRKRVLLDSLQDQLSELRRENVSLRRIIVDKAPHLAANILQECTTEESLLLASNQESTVKLIVDPVNVGSSGHPLKQFAQILMEPDFRLIQALITSQQNFVLSDPSLPDYPIVYCSEGFCKLTGYKRQDVLGRNCRFLQGPGTDQAAVDVIRRGVAEGRDISVCLLNYKSDGTPFWNQFFVAALRDADGGIVNFVGVQCEVNIPPINMIKDRIKKIPIPE